VQKGTGAKGDLKMGRKLSHEEMMDRAWKFIAKIGIAEKDDANAQNAEYLVENIHQVRDAYYTDLESGHNFEDEDMEGFFSRHGIKVED
jgi:hypothetical protein